MTRVGTCHFRSLADACKYYAEYGFSKEAVLAKLKQGEIKLGKPTHSPQSAITVGNWGRYFVTYK